MTDRFREDQCDVPLLDVAEKIRTRRVSPVDVTKSVLARIDALDDRLNAFVTVLSEQALEDASEAAKKLQAYAPDEASFRVTRDSGATPLLSR